MKPVPTPETAPATGSAARATRATRAICATHATHATHAAGIVVCLAMLTACQSPSSTANNGTAPTGADGAGLVARLGGWLKPEPAGAVPPTRPAEASQAAAPPPPAAPPPADSHGVVSTGPRASADEIKAMLLRSDPAACSATTDATLAQTVSTYGKLAVSFGAELVDTRVQGSDAQLQGKLDEMKPVMRELSRNTNWLPLGAERLFGEQIYAHNGFEPYTPRNKALRRLHEAVVLPIFEDLRRYARETLRSELAFELRLYRHESKTPAMIAGGILLVPSGMLDALSATERPDELVAFMFAHEFSHALRRHKTKKLQLTLIDSMMLAGEFRQIFNRQSTALSRLSGGPAGLFSFTKDSARSLITQSCKAGNWFPLMEQGQEFEADVCGALLLNRLSAARQQVYSPVAGYAQYLKAGLAPQPDPAAASATAPPRRAPRQSANATPQAVPSCFVTAGHPDPGDRMSNLQAYAGTFDRQAGADRATAPPGPDLDHLPPTAAGTAAPRQPGASRRDSDRGSGKAERGRTRGPRLPADAPAASTSARPASPAASAVEARPRRP